MQMVEDVFMPLIGQLVWSVHKGYESFLTMEFGEPRRYVREPIVASPDSSQKVQRSLAKRRVTILGQWHFWIQCSEWKIVTQNYTVTSREIESGNIDACLNELDGQSLLTATSGISLNSCILGFDLGGTVYISPLSEAAPDDTQWSLHDREGNVVAYRTDGLFVSSGSDGDPKLSAIILGV